MSPAGKSMMVVVGLFLFFSLSLMGPLFGNAGEFLAQTVLGVEQTEEFRNQSRANNPSYSTASKKAAGKTEGELLKPANCCETECNASWDYQKGRCLLNTNRQNTCLQKCISKP